MGPSAGPKTCDVDSWSDVKVKCGECSALVKTYNYGTCNDYCASQGLSCIHAYEDSWSDNCEKAWWFGDKHCDFNFLWEGWTHDGVCECSTGSSLEQEVGEKIMTLATSKGRLGTAVLTFFIVCGILCGVRVLYQRKQDQDLYYAVLEAQEEEI